MKTNVPIELSEVDRSMLADLIDGKETKRLATRKEIVELCQRHIGGLVEQSNQTLFYIEPPAENRPKSADRLSVPDPEDKVLLANKDPSYIRGWNQVKRGAKR